MDNSEFIDVLCVHITYTVRAYSAPLHPGRFQKLFVNDLDLNYTKGQNMGKKQVNVEQPNISKFRWSTHV